MPRDRILILAGTAEARELANALVQQGAEVVSSFAGVTSKPMLPHGEIRTGGFGGADGLAAYLQEARIKYLVDATHPFAAQMSRHAFAAAKLLALPLLRLERPAWIPQPDDLWIEATSLQAAAEQAPSGARLLLTTGRKGLADFFAREDLSGIVRTIEPPPEPLPQRWSLLQDRPPYELASELHLLRHERIGCLVTKNAGGASTAAKLAAARQLSVPVLMIQRPGKPPCETVASVGDAMIRLQAA